MQRMHRTCIVHASYMHRTCIVCACRAHTCGNSDGSRSCKDSRSCTLSADCTRSRSGNCQVSKSRTRSAREGGVLVEPERGGAGGKDGQVTPSASMSRGESLSAFLLPRRNPAGEGVKPNQAQHNFCSQYYTVPLCLASRAPRAPHCPPPPTTSTLQYCTRSVLRFFPMGYTCRADRNAPLST